MPPFFDYELIDSGDGRKLERFAQYTFDRPCPLATWQPAQAPELWRAANATFLDGSWEGELPPDAWIKAGDAILPLRLLEGGQVGVFPEQAVNWRWISKQAQSLPLHFEALNAFAFTGASSFALATAATQQGKVIHLDASATATTIARNWAGQHYASANAKIAWIDDDALAYTRRLIKRGASLSAIIADPPSFGRGPGGKIWKIERDLPDFLAVSAELLREKGRFFLLTWHSPSVSRSTAQWLIGKHLGSLDFVMETLPLYLSDRAGRRIFAGEAIRAERMLQR